MATLVGIPTLGWAQHNQNVSFRPLSLGAVPLILGGAPSVASESDLGERLLPRSGSIVHSIPPADWALYLKLQQRPPRQFPSQMSLAELSRGLQSIGIASTLRRAALEDEGFVAEDTLVQFQAYSGASSLYDEINLALEDYDLRMLPHKGRARISTLADWELNATVVTFDISQLSAHFGEYEIIEMVMRSVAPDQWEDNGGPAGFTVNELNSGTQRLLVVRQRFDIQIEVLEQLNTWKAMKGLANATPLIMGGHRAIQATNQSTPVTLPLTDAAGMGLPRVRFSENHQRPGASFGGGGLGGSGMGGGGLFHIK